MASRATINQIKKRLRNQRKCSFYIAEKKSKLEKVVALKSKPKGNGATMKHKRIVGNSLNFNVIILVITQIQFV